MNNESQHDIEEIKDDIRMKSEDEVSSNNHG